MNGESSLNIIDKPEVLVGLVDLDHVHEPGGELGVGADLAVDLDQTLLQDGLNLLGWKREMTRKRVKTRALTP